MTYKKEILGAFQDIETFAIGWAEDSKDAGYFTANPQDGKIVLTLDTSCMPNIDGIDREKSVKKIAAALNKAGIDGVQVVSQYKKFTYAESPFEQNGQSQPGAISTGMEDAFFETNPNPPGVIGGDVNYAKLVVTLPDELDSVVKLKTAHRNIVEEAAAAHLKDSNQPWERRLSHATALLEELEPKQGAVALDQLLEDLGFNKDGTLLSRLQAL